jgi:WD40 repeat protein
MDDGTLKVWDWSSNTVLFNLNWLSYAQTNNICNVKFLKSGLLAAPSASATINVWDVTTGQVRFSLPDSVLALEELSNSYLASSSIYGGINIWNTVTGQRVNQIQTGGRHFALKQTRVANYLASASEYGYIFIWNVNTLQAVDTLAGHTDQVPFLDSTPDGLLLSGSYDYTVRLWNISKMDELNTRPVPTRITSMKVISSDQLVVAFMADFIQIIKITLDNVLTLASQVNLIRSYRVIDMRLTRENILLLAQGDGSVIFLNTNTSTFLQALRPSSSSFPLAMDLIG